MLAHAPSPLLCRDAARTRLSSAGSASARGLLQLTSVGTVVQRDSLSLSNQPLMLCLSTCPQLSPEPRAQPQLLVVRAFKTNGNVVQSLGGDDKIAQRAPQVPNSIGTRQAA